MASNLEISRNLSYYGSSRMTKYNVLTKVGKTYSLIFRRSSAPTAANQLTRWLICSKYSYYGCSNTGISQRTVIQMSCDTRYNLTKLLVSLLHIVKVFCWKMRLMQLTIDGLHLGTVNPGYFTLFSTGVFTNYDRHE